MGHICVVMRATHDIRPAGRMFDMPGLSGQCHRSNVVTKICNGDLKLARQVSLWCVKYLPGHPVITYR
jgi:hypothetical protein